VAHRRESDRRRDNADIQIVTEEAWRNLPQQFAEQIMTAEAFIPFASVGLFGGTTSRALPEAPFESDETFCMAE
jgi:hypothetical protein